MCFNNFAFARFVRKKIKILTQDYIHVVKTISRYDLGLSKISFGVLLIEKIQ